MVDCDSQGKVMGVIASIIAVATTISGLLVGLIAPFSSQWSFLFIISIWLYEWFIFLSYLSNSSKKKEVHCLAMEHDKMSINSISR